MTKTRTLHRLIGLIMLLPFLGWAITGAIFFIKPGYAGAYEMLQVKTYPLAADQPIQANAAWLEMRYLKTILGEHLLVRTEEGWQHLDPQTHQPKPAPNEEATRTLLNDALAINPARYGQIVSVNGTNATTSTGVQVKLNWERMTLSQRGADTDRLDFFYRIHYLQWTGIASVDKILGGLGITFVVLLSLFGAILFFRK
ncbi:MAG: PepSY domain-containing protein [Acidobacteria bacterium]|nr:PepSY domain-containing protein [Acidobacteriota bacterium]